MRALSSSTPNLKRAVWPALIPGAALFVWMQATGYVNADMIGVDSHAYWVAARYPETWYSSLPGYRDAFLYSPAFAQILWPVAQLPWPMFQAVWIAVQALSLGWLLAPLGWWRALILAPFFAAEFLLGNIYLFMAFALVVMQSRTPGATAFLFLTTISPGVVALWYPLRREWGAFATITISTFSIVLVSALISPDAWVEWILFLFNSASTGSSSLYLRWAAALILVLISARSNRSWLLAPAALVASPVLGGLSPLSLLAALPRLFARDHVAAQHAQVGRQAALSASGDSGKQ